MRNCRNSNSGDLAKLPYADKEKQKAYCREYQKKQRELLKKLKEKI
jgi:hypothetical protein